jgi:hypothetical protein
MEWGNSLILMVDLMKDNLIWELKKVMVFIIGMMEGVMKVVGTMISNMGKDSSVIKQD